LAAAAGGLLISSSVVVRRFQKRDCQQVRVGPCCENASPQTLL
jgi:hypothetical protein